MSKSYSNNKKPKPVNSWGSKKTVLARSKPVMSWGQATDEFSFDKKSKKDTPQTKKEKLEGGFKDDYKYIKYKTKYLELKKSNK